MVIRSNEKTGAFNPDGTPENEHINLTIFDRGAEHDDLLKVNALSPSYNYDLGDLDLEGGSASSGAEEGQDGIDGKVDLLEGEAEGGKRSFKLE